MRLATVTAAAFLLLPAGSAMAIQGIGLSPTSREVTLNPGESQKGDITVINDGDNDINYKVYASDYTVAGETYRGVFTNAGNGPVLSPVTWFTLPAGTLTVKARQEVTFPYKVAVPLGAAVGGHYAAIFVQTIPPANAGAAIINRVDRVASIFYLAVGGSLDKRGDVLPLSVPWLQTLPPVEAGARLHNSGNVHFLTEGTAQLSSPFGSVGHQITFRGEVLPGTTRRFDIQLPSASPIGLYKVNVSLNYLGKTVHQSRWMLLVPMLTLIIVGATLLLLVVMIIVWLVRRRRRTPGGAL